MGAFPEPTPRKVKKVLRLPIAAPDNSQLKKLATGILAFGPYNYTDLSAWMGKNKSEVKQLLEEYNEDIHRALLALKASPQDTLPDTAELFAKLVVEANRGDRSSDRQRAIDTLLRYKENESSRDILGEFRTG